MINLRQKELYDWQLRNFGEESAEDMAWGMIEELGEMAHFLLKRKQGIREGKDNDCKDEIADSYADYIIFGLQLCTIEGIDAQKVIYNTKFKFAAKTHTEHELVCKIGDAIQKINFRVNNTLTDADWQRMSIQDSFRKAFYFGAKLIEMQDLDYEEVLQGTIQKILERDWKNNPKGVK